MLVDPRIALGGQAPQIDLSQFSPVNQMATFAKMQTLAQENKLNALKIRQAEAEAALDPSAPDYVNQLLKVNPKAGRELRKLMSEESSAEATRDKNRVAAEAERRKLLAQSQRDISSRPSDANITAWMEDIHESPLFSVADKQKVATRAEQLLALPFEQRQSYLASQGASASELKPEFKQFTVPGVGVQTGTVDYTGKFTPGQTFTEQISPYQRQQLDISRGQLGVAQGNLANAQQRLMWEKSNPGYEIKDTDSGLVAVNKRNPADVRPVTMGGAPVQSTKGLTESQAKATGFAARAKEADQLISSLEFSPFVVATKQGAESVYGIGGMLGTGVNVMMSPENQKAEQAQRNFINAVLRQESGAAITESEFQNARKQYFPEPGDSPEKIKQKAQNRATTIRSLEAIAGPGMKKMRAEPEGQPSGSSVREQADAILGR